MSDWYARHKITRAHRHDGEECRDPRCQRAPHIIECRLCAGFGFVMDVFTDARRWRIATADDVGRTSCRWGACRECGSDWRGVVYAFPMRQSTLLPWLLFPSDPPPPT